MVGEQQGVEGWLVKGWACTWNKTNKPWAEACVGMMNSEYVKRVYCWYVTQVRRKEV